MIVVSGCLALLGGAGFARVVLLSSSVWLVVVVPVALISLRRHSLVTALCLAVLCFGLGWWRGTELMRRMEPYQRLQKQQVTIVGRATTSGVYGDRSQLTFTMSDLSVARPYYVKLPGSMTIKGFGAPAIYRSDTVQVSGKLYLTRGNNVAGMSFAEVRVVASQPTVIDRFRERFAAGLQSALPEPQASFGLGLLVGQRSTLPETVAESLVMVGLTHIIAVSGYNLTILVEVARRMFVKRSKFQTTAACLLLIATFLLITGSSPPIVRASMISLLSIAAWYYGRTVPSVALLLVAAAITVFANPAYIWGNVSWYLSFLAFFGVVVLSPLVIKRLYGDKQPRLVVQIVIESLAAEALTLPYVLYIFGQISTVSLLANVFVATLVPLAMLLGVIAGLAGMFVPILAGWFAWPAAWLLGYMLHMAGALSSVPHAFLEHIGFSFAAMAVCYVIVGAVMLILRGKQRQNYAIITDNERSKGSEGAGMSGHSKWSTIKREKGAKDAARGAVFTKLGNAIAIAARSGTDPNTNFALRLAIDKAKAANMPLANIDRAIQRVADKSAAQLQELLYEGYGPGGVAILVEVATDNINRTYPEVRLAFSKHGGNIAEKGAVAFQFDQKGMIRVRGKGDELLMQALEAGADDVQEEGEESVIYTEPKELAKVRDALRTAGLEVTEAELTFVPNTSVEVTDKETAGKLMRLMNALEDVDDVTNTHVNFDIPEELLA